MPQGTFEDWQAKVNVEVVKICGMGVEDIPDYDYWSAWDAGESPTSVAKAAVKAAHFY